jgi:ABC-type transporter MlaC component
MCRKAGGWRIDDVTFDGLSVIENYLAQFDHVIQHLAPRLAESP